MEKFKTAVAALLILLMLFSAGVFIGGSQFSDGGAAVSRLLALGKAPEALNEAELTAVARFATTAASLSTEHFGGISSIPDLQTVLDRIERT